MLTKYKLRDLIDVTRGMSLPGEYYSETGEYIRLTMGNFNYNGGGFKENTSKTDIYYTGPVRDEYILNKGDIITPLTEQAIGLLGTTAMIPESGKYIQSQDVALITCKEDKLDHLYCYYLISSDLVKKQLSAAAQQTKIRHTSPDKIMDCTVWIPEMGIQQRIGKTLYEIDQKIVLNTRMNAELEAMAKQLYDYWFVQFDFPDENGNPYKSSGGKMVYNSTLKREIPKEWDVKQMSDIAQIIAGRDCPKSFSLAKNESYPIPIYSNGIDNNGLYGYTDKAASPEKSVTVSARGTIGYPILRLEPFVPIIRLIVATPYDEGADLYLYEYLRVIDIKNTGSVQPQLPVPEFSMITIPYPKDNQIIKLFSDLTRGWYKAIDKNRKYNEYLKNLRDSLLPMLMNGQVTV